MQTLQSLSEDDKKLLSIYGLGEFASQELFDDEINSVVANPNAFVQANQVINQKINILKNKINTIYSSLFPVVSPNLEEHINDAFLEILFDGEVDFHDFSAAKSLMSEWNLIMEGYARALKCSNEEFEILEIVKSSPARFKVKVALKYTKLFIEILAGLVAIERSVVLNQILINQWKSSNMVQDEEDKAFLQKKKDNLDASTKKQIDEMVDARLKEHGITDEEANSFLRTSAQKQFVFMNKGGDVTIYLNEGAPQELDNKRKEIATNKGKIHEIKSSVQSLQIEEKTAGSGKEEQDIEGVSE